MRSRSLLLLALPALLLAGCGDDEAAGASAGSGATGTVAVHLEDVTAPFIEGFEVGLRFETAEGEVIETVRWADFVAAQDSDSLDAFYDSVLEQEVPAGEVVVLATANIGIGPPPEVPDLDGELRCRLPVDVLAGGRVDVEVTFSGDDDCLRLR